MVLVPPASFSSQDFDDLLGKRRKHEVEVGYHVRDTPDWKAYSDCYTIEDLDRTVRILLIAKTGYGKSYAIRGLGDRLYHQEGMKLLYGNDTKGEMKFSRYPNDRVAEQLRYALPPKIFSAIPPEKIDEHWPARAIDDLEVFSPEFYPAPGARKFSLKFSSLTEPLAQMLLRIGSLDQAPHQHRVLQAILEAMKHHKKRGDDKITPEVLEDLKVRIPQVLTADGKSVISEEDYYKDPSFRRVFDVLMYNIEGRVIDGDHATTVPEMLVDDDGHFVSSVMDWSRVPREVVKQGKSVYQTYIAATLYQLLAMKMGQLPVRTKDRILVAFDEMQKFTQEPGKDEKTPNPVYDAVEDFFTQGRQFGLSSLIALQYGERVSGVLVKQAEHIFLSALDSPGELRKFRPMLRAVFKETEEDFEKVYKIVGSLQRHQFLALNRDMGEYGVIQFHPTMSMHKTILEN